ncbi:PhzF family phenazine biosynthesis protein [Vibrio hippocampi]|uniref:Isomerase YddE n=1 Tax=Vibrio hippocampi TaxID=654686 RepID=A0ABM8ZLG2_9VIBR|nr:PhzF family phenazine biosynthesis protein [Vibrio hippocampi]CAH0528741.1 putative isomerase YddE [Vibrio hippocampi]
MQLDVFQVNAFTNEPFRGNPAGVVITEDPLATSLMLSIAKEMALSETAFLTLNDQRLRWFTPKSEVALCGHGTLAMVQVMSEMGLLDATGQYQFQTLSGTLPVIKQGARISMTFPRYDVIPSTQDSSVKLQALGLRQDDLICHKEIEGGKDLFVLKSEEQLHHLKPNFHQLMQTDGRAIIVTAKSSRGDVDFTARYFAPWVGVDEDPVTGSAFCALAPFWSGRLDKHHLVGYQDSERGGYVAALVKQDSVEISGQAVTLIKGTLML